MPSVLALRRAQGGKVVLVQRRAGPARGPEVIRHAVMVKGIV